MYCLVDGCETSRSSKGFDMRVYSQPGSATTAEHLHQPRDWKPCRRKGARGGNEDPRTPDPSRRNSLRVKSGSHSHPSSSLCIADAVVRGSWRIDLYPVSPFVSPVPPGSSRPRLLDLARLHTPHRIPPYCHHAHVHRRRMLIGYTDATFAILIQCPHCSPSPSFRHVQATSIPQAFLPAFFAAALALVICFFHP